MNSKVTKVRSLIAFLFGLSTAFPVWAYRGGRGEADAAFIGLLLLVLLVFAVLIFIGYALGERNAVDAVFAGLLFSLFALCVGGLVAELFGSVAGWIAGLGVVVWFTKRELLTELKPSKRWADGRRAGPDGRTRQQRTAVVPEEVEGQQHDVYEKRTSDLAHVEPARAKENENERIKREREQEELIHAQRRAEADLRARAYYERTQKAEQQRLAEIQERVDKEREAREQKQREEQAAQEIARMELEQRDAAARSQWELAQRAERKRLRYQEEGAEPENQQQPNFASVSYKSRRSLAPQSPGQSASSPVGGPLPILRADHWRMKGDSLICLASGVTFEKGQYRVDDGWYIVNASQHRGKIRVAEVADLVRSRK